MVDFPQGAGMDIGKTGNIHYVKQETQFRQMLAALMCFRFFQQIGCQQITINYLKIIRHIKVHFYSVPACLLRVRAKDFQPFEQGLKMPMAQGLDELSVSVD